MLERMAFFINCSSFSKIIHLLILHVAVFAYRPLEYILRFFHFILIWLLCFYIAMGNIFLLSV